MKKFLPYILILTIIVQLFAPFSVGLGTKNNIEVQSNKVQAEETTGIFAEDNGIKVETTSTTSSTTITIQIKVIWSDTSGFSDESVIIGLVNPNGEGQTQMPELTPKGTDTQNAGVVFGQLEPNTEYKVWIHIEKDSKTFFQKYTNLIKSVNPTYYVGKWIGADEWPLVGGLFEKENSNGSLTNKDNPYIIKTLEKGDTSTVTTKQQPLANEAAFLPTCSIDNVGGCIAVIIYRLIYQPSAYIFAFTGKILDYTFFYTINDTSYRSEFVVKGWGIVRDFCNMFFIFILLYVAFGTILKLHGVKTKEMIINVIIIGLLINFSLFATQVIIDASNILARVFYKQILIGPKDPDGVIRKEELGYGNSKQLSVALVGKVNPQELVMRAADINQINVKGANSNPSNQTNGIDNSTFIMVTLLASAVNIVGLYVFFMISMIFIVRVVGLWLAMILVPVTFFSYAVPQMQDIEMIGWKKWWPETLKLAFLAPVFIFFIYLIIQFLNSGMGIKDASNKSGIDFFIATIVPFAFLMVLLLKTKDITTKMAGKLGEMASKAASTVGGAVVGAGLMAATGGAAMAMRGTLGRAGSAIANSEGLKRAESRGVFGAKMLRNIGSSAGKGSFDVRGTKLGALASKTGGFDMGKAKEGGFEKARAEKVAYRQKRAKELEVGEDSAQTQAARQAEHALHAVKTDRARQDALLGLNNGIAFGQRQDAIDTANANLIAAQAARAGLPATAIAGTPIAEEIRLADIAVNEANAALISSRVADSGLGGLERAITTAERALGVEERALKDAETTLLAADPAQKAAAQLVVNNARISRDAAATTRDNAKNNLEARQTTIRAQERQVHVAEDNLKRAQNAVIEANNNIRHDYAHTIQGAWSNAINTVVTLGQHSIQGEREAANKILSGIEADKKITEHH